MSFDDIPLDAAYYENENLFLGIDVQAYVEGLQDRVFWHDVFELFAPTLKMRFFPGSRSNDASRGKREVLKLLPTVNPYLIICIDSDFDELINPVVYNSLFVFQTYLYATESYKCVPKFLNRMLRRQTGSNELNFDFNIFLENYSKAIYRLFLYQVYFKRQNPEIVEEIEKYFILADRKNATDRHGEAYINEVTANVESAIKEFERKYPDANTTKISEELKDQFGIGEVNVYLYMNGHILYEHVVSLVIKYVFLKTVTQEFNNLKTLQGTEEQKKELQNEYKNFLGYDIEHVESEAIIQTHKPWQKALSMNYTECLHDHSFTPVSKLKQKAENLEQIHKATKN